MTPRSLLLHTVLLLGITSLTQAQQARQFTDKQGRTLRATFVSVQQDQVTLRLESGQTHSIPISNFSSTDQQWLRTQAEQSGTAIEGATPTPAGGMAFAPNWLPRALTARRELLENIEFYCKAVLGDAPRGKEVIPGTIVSGIRWRMPIDEVVQKILPKGFNKLSERPMVHECLPNGSLINCGFQFKSFVDREQYFNQLFMLIDKERCVVSVMFVDQNGRSIRWFPRPDGIREPYYNFINLTHNGSTTKEVPYQILDGGPGVKCIKTALQERMHHLVPPGLPYPYINTKENVHWYIPAPFARAMLDIVESYRKAGVIK